MEFTELFKEYKGKIRSLAFQSKTKNGAISMDIEELEQELALVLWEAHKTFDKDTKNEFSTYFYSLAQNRMVDIVRHNFADVRKVHSGDMTSLEEPVDKQMNAIPLHEILSDKTIDIEGDVAANDLHNRILDYIGTSAEDIDLYKSILGFVTIKELSTKYNKHPSGLYRRKENLRHKIANFLS